MNDQQTPESPDDRPRLGPRPLTRPEVDPSSAAVFGRPTGVDGAFSPQPGGPAGARTTFAELKAAPPVPESLASAFGRPADATELLQRPPEEDAPNGVDPWDDEAAGDPWRDPAAGAVIGPPALGAEDAKRDGDRKKSARPAGELLSLPELIFGRRVKVTALLTLAVVALLVGAVGGIAGWYVGRGGERLNQEITLAQVSEGKERPAGSIADIARRVRPAVVTIEVRAGDGDAAEGSGAVIDSNGYILTNEHVVTMGGAVTEGQDLSVKFIDGTRAKAELVGMDAKSDLAVIKVDVRNPTVIQLGRSSDLQVGDSVIAIGSPLRQNDTVTEGIVSALNRPVLAGEDGEPAVYDAIQTDAAINQGNSGGPLVDSTGALVGINSSIQTSGTSTGSIGVGYAIPIDYAKSIIEALIRDGKVNHADMGVNVASVSADTAEGARVQNVRDGGAAAKAGIKQGDVIRKVGDRDIADAAELIVAVRSHDVGERVPVVLARSGRELTVQVTLESD
jgi:S1-C subfamily serine protease